MSDKDVDLGRRRFLTAATSVVGGVGVAVAAVPFVASMLPSERAKAAGAAVEVDISKLEENQLLRVEWRGQPVWILMRSDAAMEDLKNTTVQLADKDSVEEMQPAYAQNALRSIKDKILVVVGICTHLGCSPTHKPEIGPASGLGDDWNGGFFCPCHGSKFDLSGRVYAGFPAPTNLTVPPYMYLSDNRILVGEDEGAA